MITRTIGRHIAPPVMALWVAEVTLAFLLVALMGSPGFWKELALDWPSGTEMRVLNHSALLAVTLGGTAGVIGLYRPEICFEPRRVALHAAIVALLAFPVAFLVGSAWNTGKVGLYAIWLAKVMGIWVLAMLVSRWALRVPLSRALCPRNLLLVASPQDVASFTGALRSRHGALFSLSRVMRPEDPPPSAAALRADGIWAVVAPESAAAGAGHWLLDYRLRGLPVFHEAGFCEQMLGRVSLGQIDAGWFLDPAGFAAGRVSLALKRATDIAGSLVLLAVALPVMLVTAIVIKLDSRGPIFYRQERVGLGGRPFMVIKFRSMRADAERGGRAVWAQQRDPRVTRVGAFIRSTRIDELPQLFNVLRGEMSLVGPRPERPVFVEELARVIPFYHERSYVKPGLTGWAQINYPYGASIEDAREKLCYDLYYLRHRGFFFDLLILASTVRVILFREGAR